MCCALQELYRIQENSPPGFTADAVDDDVHVWNVHFSGFPEDSPLSQDLVKLYSAYDFASIQLR